MSNKYNFFYDETEHSRKLTNDTLVANNFQPYFLAGFIGIPKEKYDELERKYIDIENKYKQKYNVEELKSRIFKQAKFEQGFYKFKDDDVNFLTDVIDFVLCNDIKFNLCIFNKFEYLINQTLIKCGVPVKYPALYSFTKLLTLYRPLNVINGFYKTNSEFIKEVVKFIQRKNEITKDIIARNLENEICNELIEVVNVCETENIKIEWPYQLCFRNLKRYSEKEKICIEELIIDSENGEKGSTLEAAKKVFGEKSFDANSKNEFGIRLVDILIGVISKFVISIQKSMTYENLENAKELKYVCTNRYLQTSSKHKLVKLFSRLLERKNNEYKIFGSFYVDSYIAFNTYVDFISCRSLDELLSFENIRAKLNLYINGKILERINEIENLNYY